MKKSLLVYLISLLQTLSFAQGKYDANWCFGVKAGISFVDTTNPTNFNTLCNNYDAAVSISDSLGNLLFYVAPRPPLGTVTENPWGAIYGADNNIIANGDSLWMGEGKRLTGALFLPIPDHPHSFYLFYMAWTGRLGMDSLGNQMAFEYDSLLLTRIDWDSASQRYYASSKNVGILNTPIEWGIAAAKHANGKDWWLLVHESNQADTNYATNTFYRFLVTGDSILGPYSQDYGTMHRGKLVFGQMIFSRQSDRLAVGLEDQNALDVFGFDRCRGLLNNYIPLDTIDSNGIAEIFCGAFSTTGKKLYVINGGGDIQTGNNGINQYSLDSPNVRASKVMVWDSALATYDFGDMRLAPDGKIYFTVVGGNCCPYASNYYNQYNQYLWVINNPDSSGLACDLQPYGYYLGDSARSYFGLPNMPNYNLGPISVYAADAGPDATLCKDSTENVTLGVPSIPNVVYHWRPSDGLSDTSTAQPTADPDTDTYYTLTVVDTSQMGTSCDTRTDTVFVHVVQKCGVGIGEVSGQLIKVYPNPVFNDLIIEIPSSNEAVFTLYNTLGQKVIEESLQQRRNILDISFLSNGFYLYHIGNFAGKIQVFR